MGVGASGDSLEPVRPEIPSSGESTAALAQENNEEAAPKRRLLD
jgi:hypothetical protein